MRKERSLLAVLLIVVSVLCGCANGTVPEDNGGQSNAPMQESSGASGTEEHPETEVKTPDVQEAVPYVRTGNEGGDNHILPVCGRISEYCRRAVYEAVSGCKGDR